MDTSEFLITPDQFQVPRIIKGLKGDSFQLDSLVGSGEIANVGVFKGQWIRQSNEPMEAAIKITTEHPKELEEEYIFLNHLKAIQQAKKGYLGAHSPEIYQRPDPFTVKLGAGEKEAFALVMEWVKGKPLDEIVKESSDGRPFDLQKASSILSQIGLFNTQILHPAGTTDIDIQPKNYFIPESESARVYKVDFDMRASVDLPHLQDEYRAYLRLAYKLFTGQSGDSIDFQTGKVDFSALRTGIVGRRYTRALVEYAYAGYSRATTVEELEKAYNDLVTAITIPSTIAYTFCESDFSTVISGLIAQPLDSFSKQTEVYIAGLLDVAEQRGINFQLSPEAEARARELGITETKAVNGTQLCELALAARKQRTEAYSLFENATRQVRGRGYSEAYRNIKQGAALVADVDPFNIRYRRYIPLVSVYEMTEDKSHWINAVKIAASLYEGKVSEATNILAERGMKVTRSPGTLKLVENEPLQTAPSPIKSLFYETTARYLLQQVVLLEQQGELTQAFNLLQLIQPCLDQISDGLYRSALIDSEPQFTSQALFTRTTALDERIRKGESVEVLRKQNSDLRQQLAVRDVTIAELQRQIAERDAIIKQLKTELAKARRPIIQF
ncbi:hypothetical protein FJY90_05200 [Candidatus Gottesmanbacteria bacterium]|nr:hypothetical protein [Candidatus Gottesmanbacteria bacterium]